MITISFRKFWRANAVGLAAVAAVALLSACERSKGSVPPSTNAAPIQVETVRLEHGSIARRITLPTFRILPLQQATLYAKVAGYLKTLAVDKGDRVQAGQLLAEIEVPELLADQAQFVVEAEVARTNYDRMIQARRQAPDLVVPQTVEDLRGQAETARAKLERVRTLLAYTRILAPFSGTITARFVDPGAFIPAATGNSTPQSAALVTLMDFSQVRVQVFVPEPEVPLIRTNLPVQIRVEALPNRVFTGTVTRIAEALDDTTRSMLTEIQIPNPKGELRPGMYASVQLEVERKADAPLLPEAAVVNEKAGTFVYLAVQEKAKRTAVHTGFNDGVHVEIRDGIPPDAAVILAGNQALVDGQTIAPREAK